jgi:CelD/BcsL family acetyltransferase involved in cellulose biosynthesis
MELLLLDVLKDQQRVEQIWKDLSDNYDCSYFLSWGWMEHWISTLPKRARVKLAVVTNGNGPVLAFFIGQATITKGGIFRSKAFLLNQTGYWDYDRLYIEHNAVLRSRDCDCSLSQILEMLPRNWEEIYFSAVDASTFPATDLDSIGAHYDVFIANVIPSPYVDLQLVRQRLGDYLGLLGSNVRSQTKRAYRLYASQGPVVTEVATDLATALQIYDELIELHQSSWKKRGKAGAFASAYFRTFHRNLIEKRFAAGEIQLIRVSCCQSTVGCVYNFVFRGTVYFYQSGLAFDSDNRLKPGYICHVEAVKFNAEAGNLFYDFLAGFEAYKERLSTHKRSLVWARVQKPRMKFKVERFARRAAVAGLAKYHDWKRSSSRALSTRAAVQP